MKLKKCNAILTLLITALLIDHAASFSIYSIRGVRDFVTIPAYVLAALTAAHAVIGIFMLLRRCETPQTKYPGLCRATQVQRISGIAMIALLAAHIPLAVFDETLLVSAAALLCAVQILFVLAAMVHTAVSLPNALVTLGRIGSLRSYRTVRIICAVISGVLALLGIAAFLALTR